MDQLRLFGKRVRAIRKNARITQEEASERARFNAKYLGQIERGEKRPSFETIVALAKALNCTPDAFFQLDVEENDNVMRRKIDSLLHKTDETQLRRAYRVLKALLEP